MDEIIIPCILIVCLVAGVILSPERSADEWFSKETSVSLIVLSAALITGTIGPSDLYSVFTDKGEVILIIFLFFLLSEGLSESGFFKYVAMGV